MMGRGLQVMMTDDLHYPSDSLKSLCVSPLDVVVVTYLIVQQDVSNNRLVEKEQNVLVNQEGPQLPNKMEPLVYPFAASSYVSCPVEIAVDDGAKVLVQLHDSTVSPLITRRSVNYDLLCF